MAEFEKGVFVDGAKQTEEEEESMNEWMNGESRLCTDLGTEEEEEEEEEVEEDAFSEDPI